MSISLEDFVRGEGFNEVIVQVAAVRTLLDVAVLGEILHPHPDVHHRLPAVLAVETGLRTHRTRVSSGDPSNGDVNTGSSSRRLTESSSLGSRQACDVYSSGFIRQMGGWFIF